MAMCHTICSQYSKQSNSKVCLDILPTATDLRIVNCQVTSLQNSTRLVTNLEIAVHVGPQGVNTFHTLFQRPFSMKEPVNTYGLFSD